MDFIPISSFNPALNVETAIKSSLPRKTTISSFSGVPINICISRPVFDRPNYPELPIKNKISFGPNPIL